VAIVPSAVADVACAVMTRSSALSLSDPGCLTSD